MTVLLICLAFIVGMAIGYYLYKRSSSRLYAEQRKLISKQNEYINILEENTRTRDAIINEFEVERALISVVNTKRPSNLIS